MTNSCSRCFIFLKKIFFGSFRSHPPMQRLCEDLVIKRKRLYVRTASTLCPCLFSKPHPSDQSLRWTFLSRSLYHRDHLPSYGNDWGLWRILGDIYKDKNKTWFFSLSPLKVGSGKLKHTKINLSGLVVSNSDNGKTTFFWGMKSFEYATVFIFISLGDDANTARYKEVKTSSFPKIHIYKHEL